MDLDGREDPQGSRKEGTNLIPCLYGILNTN